MRLFNELFLFTLSLAALSACSGSDEEPAPRTVGGASSRGGETGRAGGTSTSAGAGGQTSVAGAAGTAAVELRGRCEPGARTGDFSAVLEPDVTTVRGQVWNRALATRVTTEVAREGDCWLTKSESPRCATPCSGTDVCGAEERCVPASVSRSVGDVKVTGLAAPVAMSPLMPGNNYFVSGDFPARGFEPGASIDLSATGGDLEPFELHGIGVEGLELPADDWILRADVPFVVTWQAGTTKGAVVRVSLNVDQHGSAPVNLACETADDGELSIDAVLVNALLEAGVTGFPSGHVNRETVDSVQLANGCIELSVGAHVRRGLGVDGYVACTKQSDCPEGKTCNLKLQRCE